jgi:hypothetical protein
VSILPAENWLYSGRLLLKHSSGKEIIMKFLLALASFVRSRRKEPDARLPQEMPLREWADLPPYHPVRDCD